MARTIIINTDILDRVWNEWLDKQELTNHERARVLGRPFGVVARMNKREKFENWLFNQGASIRRINKKFHLEFTDSKQASFFLLRWS